MKIFEFNSVEEMKNGSVARQVDSDGNSVNEDGTPVVTVNALAKVLNCLQKKKRRWKKLIMG